MGSLCGLQVDDEDVYEEASLPEQDGSRRRFWQFNDSRPLPEPLLQPSRKQKSPKRKASSGAQQPREVDMSGSSLSSRFAEAVPLQSATAQAASVTDDGAEGPYTTPDGWTVINDSLIDSAVLDRVQESGSSRGAKQSRWESSERDNARSEAVSSAEGQQPEATAGASSLMSDGIHTAKQRGAEHSLSSCLDCSPSPALISEKHDLHVIPRRQKYTLLLPCRVLCKEGFLRLLLQSSCEHHRIHVVFKLPLMAVVFMQRPPAFGITSKY